MNLGIPGDLVVFQFHVGSHHGAAEVDGAGTTALRLQPAPHDYDAVELKLALDAEVPFHQENPLPHSEIEIQVPRCVDDREIAGAGGTGVQRITPVLHISGVAGTVPVERRLDMRVVEGEARLRRHGRETGPVEITKAEECVVVNGRIFLDRRIPFDARWTATIVDQIEVRYT